MANAKPSSPRRRPAAATRRRGAAAAKSAAPGARAPVKLLSGGNPQIAKGDGDAPVRAYLATMPGWKQAVGRRLDALIERVVPDVRRAVRWNTPMYARDGQGYFIAYHLFTNYLKVTFFDGPKLDPLPPGGTRADGRWIDLHDGEFDEAQLASWIRQAAALPGWKP